MTMAEREPVSPAEPTDERNHLSIGEVLSLLQDEFPDITISKIRFLESQGLLNPERTPSGYRKFYDTDVEQLRWVLRQQRENFLPLKVIKDRLAAGRLDASPSESGILAFGTDEPAEKVASAPTPRQETASAPATPDTTPPQGGAVAKGSSGTPPAAKPSTATPAVPAAPSTEASAGSRRAPGSRSASAPSAPGDQAARVRPSAAGVDPAGLSSGESGVSMTASELCGAAGLSHRQLAELERFGLVTARMAGAETLYDEDALVVARIAAALWAHGVEPRHQRMFKLQAEREAALYEQLTVPRLKAHRSEARDEALADLARISALGDDLRTALLRANLRHALRPR
jgi:DNA-binding transcriptional MerR regulator